MALALLTCLLCAPGMTPDPGANKAVHAASTSEGASAPLGFEVRRASGGEFAQGVVVTLEALEVEGMAAGTREVQRSLEGAYVRFDELRLGLYRATIFSDGAELSFELEHDGSQREPIRALMPTADHSGKGVGARPDRLFWGGVAATSLGGALVVGGLLAVTLNPCGDDGSTGGDCRNDLRTAWGIGLSSVGGAGVGTGITMIAVGRRQRLRLRPGVDVEVGRAGLSLHGRF